MSYIGLDRSWQALYLLVWTHTAQGESYDFAFASWYGARPQREVQEQRPWWGQWWNLEAGDILVW